MRPATALVVLALIGAGAASSASPDRRRTPEARAPAALTPISVAFPNRDDGWILARRGPSGAEVLATRDAGMTWITQWAGSLVPAQVAATDPDHAWVLAQRCSGERCGSVLLGTSDAGGHWSTLAPLTLFSSPSLTLHVSQVAFASPTLGLAAARDASCRDRATGPPPQCPGWILETGDGGLHWHLDMKSAEPIAAVAADWDGLWALAASPGGDKVGVGSYPPSLTALASRDGGGSWSVRGAVHPSMSASLDVAADILATPAGRLWLTARDPETCAMHGCGVDGAWSSGDGGRHWRALGLRDRFERGVGMACGYGGAVVAGEMVAVSFNSQACAGPASALYRLGGSHSQPIHVWRAFVPSALAWPSRAVGYALGVDRADRASILRSTDGGRIWRELAFTSS